MLPAPCSHLVRLGAADPLSDTSTIFHFDSPGLDLHYTEPGTGGHGIWFGVYAHEPMYDWMFAHGVVPEPAAVVLLAMAGLALEMRRRPMDRIR